MMGRSSEKKKRRRNPVYQTLPRFMRNQKGLPGLERGKSTPLIRESRAWSSNGAIEAYKKRVVEPLEEEVGLDEEGLIINPDQEIPRTPPKTRRPQPVRTKSRRITRKRVGQNHVFLFDLNDFTSSTLSDSTDSDDYIDSHWECDSEQVIY